MKDGRLLTERERIALRKQKAAIAAARGYPLRLRRE